MVLHHCFFWEVPPPSSSFSEPRAEVPNETSCPRSSCAEGNFLSAERSSEVTKMSVALIKKYLVGLNADLSHDGLKVDWIILV